METAKTGDGTAFPFSPELTHEDDSVQLCWSVQWAEIILNSINIERQACREKLLSKSVSNWVVMIFLLIALSITDAHRNRFNVHEGNHVVFDDSPAPRYNLAEADAPPVEAINVEPVAYEAAIQASNIPLPIFHRSLENEAAIASQDTSLFELTRDSMPWGLRFEDRGRPPNFKPSSLFFFIYIEDLSYFLKTGQGWPEVTSVIPGFGAHKSGNVFVGEICGDERQLS